MDATRSSKFAVYILALVTLLPVFFSIYYLYRGAASHEKQVLHNLARQQAEAIANSALVASNESARIPGNLFSNDQLKDSAAKYWDSLSHTKTNETIIARLTHDGFQLILHGLSNGEHSDTLDPHQLRSFEPLRLALHKETGSVITEGHTDNKVIAGYSFDPETNSAVVTYVDINEVRAPYRNVFLLAVAASLFVIAAFARLVCKIARKLEDEQEKARYAQQIARHTQGIGFLRYNHVTRKLEVSEEAHDIWCTDCEELSNLDEFYDIIHPVDSDLVRACIENPLNSDNKFDIEFRIVMPDESIKWIQFRGEYLRNREGDIMSLFSTVRDISEQKQNLLSLKHSVSDLNNYKQALDEFAIIAITDRRGKINYVNDMFCKLSEYSREELIGQDHRIVNSGHHDKEFFLDLWRTICRGQIWKGEIMNRSKHGNEYWVATTIVPFTDENNRIDRFVAIRTDITEKKNSIDNKLASYAKELEIKNQELELANQTKTEFLQIASHELRTPLTIIKEFVELINDEVPGPINDDQRQCTQTVLNNCTRLKELIDDLLDLQKIDTGLVSIFRKNFCAGELLNNGFQEFLPRCQRKGVKLFVSVPESAPYVLGDKDKICQVITNLISNALKFTPEGGRIDLSMECDDEYVSISVQDTGQGIAVEDQPKVFEKFTQLDRTDSAGAKGTGLGLPICQGILEMHESTIELFSIPGEGSTFSFRLPIYQPMLALSAFVKDTVCSAKKHATDIHTGFFQLHEDAVKDMASLDDSELRAVLRRDSDRLITMPSLNLIAIAVDAENGGYQSIRTRIYHKLETKLGSAPVLSEFNCNAEDCLNCSFKDIETFLSQFDDPDIRIPKLQKTA